MGEEFCRENALGAMTQIHEICCPSSESGSANAHTHAHNFQCTAFATVLARSVTYTFMSTLEIMQKQRPLSLPLTCHCMVTTDVRLLKFLSLWTKQKSCSWQVVIFTCSLLHFNKPWLNLQILWNEILPKLAWQVQQMCSSFSVVKYDMVV